MNNRVDYLSDRLVNLRGKLKSVDEVVPPESIANGVSIQPPPGSDRKSRSSAAAVSAQDQRRKQTRDLYNDFEQRLVRRAKQLEISISSRSNDLQRLQQLQQQIDKYITELHEKSSSDDEALSPVELGERYRLIDRARLDFFAVDAELDVLLAGQSSPQALPESGGENVETFSLMLKKGWALALSLGLVLAVAILLAALIIFAGWR